jgi:hypothetical protein
MQMLSDERHTYLNKVIGRLIMISDDDIRMAKSDDPEEFLEWQDELVPDAKKVLSSDDFLKIPGKLNIHDYEINKLPYE